MCTPLLYIVTIREYIRVRTDTHTRSKQDVQPGVITAVYISTA